MHWPASPCEKNCKRPQQRQRNKFNKFFSRFLQTLSVCMLDVLSFIKKNNVIRITLICLFCFVGFFFNFLTVFKDMYSNLHFVSNNSFIDIGRYENPDFHIQMRSVVFSHRTAREKCYEVGAQESRTGSSSKR